MIRITGFPPLGFLKPARPMPLLMMQLFQRTSGLLALTLCTPSAFAEEISFQTQEEDGSTAQNSTSDTFDPLPIILTFTIAGTVVVAIGVVCACRKRDLLLKCTHSTSSSGPAPVSTPAATPGTKDAPPPGHLYENAPPAATPGTKDAPPPGHLYENAQPTAPLPAAPSHDLEAALKIPVKRQSQRASPERALEKIPRSKTVSTSNPATGQRIPTPSALERQTTNNNNPKPTSPAHPYENLPTALPAGSDLAASLQMPVGRPSQIESSPAHRPIPESLRRATTGQPLRIPRRVIVPSLENPNSKNDKENPSTPYALFEEQ